LYVIIHYHFAEKAGNRGIIHELAEDENEVLFNKESQQAGGNLLDVSMDKSNQGRRKTTLPDISKSSPDKQKLPLLKKEINEDEAMSDVDSEAPLPNNDDVDKDFAYLRYHLQQNPRAKEWMTLLDENNNNVKIKIKGKIDRVSVSKMTLHCETELEHIPKNIILKAISDMNIRAKWDQSLGNLEVLEFEKANDIFFFKVGMAVPSHMQQREAVLVRKVLKDFPSSNQTTIVHRSVEHALCPEKPSKIVRADI